MKKILFSAATILCLSASAYAMPHVGDDAVYAVSVAASGQTQTGTMEEQLVSFDASTGQYDEKTTTTTQNGQASAQDQQMTSDDLISDSQIAQVMAECAQMKGVKASVTVTAGTFSTCAVPVNSDGTTGTIWIGDVAFGVVKSDLTYSDGSHITMQLNSQHAGQ